MHTPDFFYICFFRRAVNLFLASWHLSLFGYSGKFRKHLFIQTSLAYTTELELMQLFSIAQKSHTLETGVPIIIAKAFE